MNRRIDGKSAPPAAVPRERGDEPEFIDANVQAETRSPRARG